MGSGQSATSPTSKSGTGCSETNSSESKTRTSKVVRSSSMQRSGTAKVNVNFVHQVSHELSAEETELVRELAKLTSSCQDDAPGVYENKLRPTNVHCDALDIAREIMERTQYAFNFVKHGQGKSGNIRALIDQHIDQSGASSDPSTTTKLHFQSGEVSAQLRQHHQASNAKNDSEVSDEAGNNNKTGPLTNQQKMSEKEAIDASPTNELSSATTEAVAKKGDA
jgi:hypothetical protein